MRLEAIDTIKLVRPADTVRSEIPLSTADASDALCLDELRPAMFEFFFHPLSLGDVADNCQHHPALQHLRVDLHWHEPPIFVAHSAFAQDRLPDAQLIEAKGPRRKIFGGE